MQTKRILILKQLGGLQTETSADRTRLLEDSGLTKRVN